jgi:tetratricopeptide (TPR) repeat protein
VKGKIANLHAEVAQAYIDVGHDRSTPSTSSARPCCSARRSRICASLANLYRQSGDLDAAKFELEEAVSVRPRYVPAWVALGVTRLSMADQKGAIEAWEKAKEIDPENKAAAMYLRMAKGSIAPPKA